MIKLEDLKEIKMDNKVIPLNWSQNQYTNIEFFKNEIVSIIIEENIMYEDDNDRSKKRKEAKGMALLHWIKQLKIGYLKFFKENESFESIFENKKFKFLGIEYEIESDGTDYELDSNKAKLNIKPSSMEHISLLVMDLSRVIHDILMYETAYCHIPKYVHKFDGYSILPIFVKNGIDKEFFGGSEEARISKINIGLNSYQMHYRDLDENTLGNIDKQWKSIELNRNNSSAVRLGVILHEITHGIFKEWDINVSEIYKRTQLQGGEQEDKDKLMEEEIVTRLATGLTDVFLNNDHSLYNFLSHVKPDIVKFDVKVKRDD
ncbi:hypothetical protein ACQKMI_10595 [Lysinibacillus sp. NPDC097214]|uniref:hypothetical protein n=1 Tax=Lysinibacillus sp. NPDC097214 TaxID=3390584 RepID=UPI003CFEE05C